MGRPVVDQRDVLLGASPTTARNASEATPRPLTWMWR